MDLHRFWRMLSRWRTANTVSSVVLRRFYATLVVYGLDLLWSGKWSRSIEAIGIQCHHAQQLRSKTGKSGTKKRGAPTLYMSVPERG